MAVNPGPAVAAGHAAPRLLAVRHETVYAYDTPVELAHHVVHLRPRDTGWQQVRQWALEITPAPDLGTEPQPAAMQDVWGNWRHWFSHSSVHERMQVVSRSTVCVHEQTLPDLTHSVPWERVAASLQYRAGAPGQEAAQGAAEFALASPYAPRAAALAAFAAPVFGPRRPLLEAAFALMQRVHERFEYLPFSTTTGTLALQALAQRQGVCQDFAHVMIGALRSLGLAARYVSGYILTRAAPGQPRLVGADASHAWVQVWCPLQGWVALDPTNAIPAGRDHVTVAWGRDYGDVAPMRGVIRGGGHAQPRVAVSVEALPGGEVSVASPDA